MGRPDFGQRARQMRAIASFVGETATLRHFVSASASTNDAYGIGAEPQYLAQRVSGLFRPMTFDEVNEGGGQFIEGDVMATLLDVQPNTADEIVWRGTIYRIESDFIPERIVGAAGYRGLLRRGDATG